MRHALGIALALAATILGLAGCEPDYHEAGRKAGDVYGDAATRAALDPTAAAIQRATDMARAAELGGTAAAEAGEQVPTVAAEIGERAPTVAAGAAEAAREFSAGVEESGACNGAAMLLLVGGSILGIIVRRTR
jgi:hypothetical protein